MSLNAKANSRNFKCNACHTSSTFPTNINHLSGYYAETQLTGQALNVVDNKKDTAQASSISQSYRDNVTVCIDCSDKQDDSSSNCEPTQDCNNTSTRRNEEANPRPSTFTLLTLPTKDISTAEATNPFDQLELRLFEVERLNCKLERKTRNLKMKYDQLQACTTA